MVWMKLPRAGKYSVVGMKIPAIGDDPVCVACKASGAPAIAVLHRAPASDWQIVVRICLPCVGSAVEAATGWKIQRAWSQWLASSLQAATMRTNRMGDGK
jgi:hypothetical protein